MEQETEIVPIPVILKPGRRSFGFDFATIGLTLAYRRGVMAPYSACPFWQTSAAAAAFEAGQIRGREVMS